MALYTLTDVSRHESITPEGMTITRVFDCTPYSARGTAYADLVGGVSFVGGLIRRVLPAADPDFPWCRVSDVECEPIDDTDFLVSPNSSVNPLRRASPYNGPARLKVTYKTPTYDQQDKQEIDLANQTWEFSAQNLTLPNERYGWKDDGDAAGSGGLGTENEPPTDLLAFSGIAATKTIPRLEYAIHRHFVVRKPLNAIFKLLGRINRTSFMLGRDTYPPGTLRFDSASASQKLTNRGVKFYDMTFKFAVMPLYDVIDKKGKKGFVTWNRLFDPRKGYWRRVVLVKDVKRGIYLYDTDIVGKKSKGFRLLFDRSAS